MAANMAAVDKEDNSTTLIYCSSTTHGWTKVVPTRNPEKKSQLLKSTTYVKVVLSAQSSMAQTITQPDKITTIVASLTH